MKRTQEVKRSEVEERNADYIWLLSLETRSGSWPLETHSLKSVSHPATRLLIAEYICTFVRMSGVADL